jgi:hypothetical protein
MGHFQKQIGASILAKGKANQTQSSMLSNLAKDLV